MEFASSKPSPLEIVLAKLKKGEASLYGRLLEKGHRWLSRIEAHKWMLAYSSLYKKPGSITFLRSDLAINLDSVLFLSLLFHFILLLLVSWVSFSVNTVSFPGPIRVRFIDLGKKDEPKRDKPLTTKKTRLPQPIAKPRPPLPAPKVITEYPGENLVGPTTKQIESLIRFPTQQSSNNYRSLPEVEKIPSVVEHASIRREEIKGLERLQEMEAFQLTSGSPSAIESPDFNPYIKLIEKKVRSFWEYPDGITGTQRIDLRLILDRGGKLVNVKVLASTDQNFRNSALDAIKRASPFPPIPESLKELAGWPLRIIFTQDFGFEPVP